MHETIVKKVIQAMERAALVLVEVSARHVHLSEEDAKRLFGTSAELMPKRPLSQPGQFLSEERVSLVGPRGSMENVAVLGPLRGKTQIELSKSDCVALGIAAPLRESGDLEGSGGITLEGPKGTLSIASGVIIAKRHIHVPPYIAALHGFYDKERVSVELFTDRPVVFKDVLLRVSSKFSYRMHIDFDEANAADVKGFTLGRIIRQR